MSAPSSLLSLCVIAALSLSACDAMPAAKTSATAQGPVAPAQTSPFTATGAPEPLALVESSQTDDGLQWAASVVQLDQIPEHNAKLFGVAGGDPAMNGLQTYIAFYQNPADGWAIYRIGDFLDYTLLPSANGRVDLDLHESTYDEASGEIGDRRRRIIVQWTPGPDDGAPTAVTVTPAQ